MSSSPAPRPRMSDARHRLLVGGLIVSGCLVLLAAVQATDTNPREPVTVSGRPDVVEHLIPGQGDDVIRQAQLGIDLAPGYEGALVLNGVAIPTPELRQVPQQNQVYFTPAAGKVVERLEAGTNCMTAVVWKSAVGRGSTSDQSFTWCFNAL